MGATIIRPTKRWRIARWMQMQRNIKREQKQKAADAARVQAMVERAAEAKPELRKKP